MKRLSLTLSLTLCLAAVACGNSTSTTSSGSGGTGTSSGSGGTTSSSTGAGAGGGISSHMNTCVLKTDTGNSLGVGKYCTPSGEECSGLMAGLCTADIGEDEWFCVKIGCQMDSDCGEDATCDKQQGSSGCVPSKCVDGAGGSGGAGGSSSSSSSSSSGG